MSEIHKDQMPQITRYTPQPRLPKPGGQGGGGLTGRDIWRIIRKRKWQIIIPTAIVTIITGVATLIWLALAPFYTAVALLSVEPPSGGPMETTRMLSSDIVERMVMSHAQLVSRETVLRSALDSESVQKTTWYKSDPSSAVERLDDALSVSISPNTNIIRVSVTTTYKSEVADIATAVAVAYAEFSGKDARRSYGEKINILTDGGKSIQMELDRLRREYRASSSGGGGSAGSLADVQAKRSLFTGKLQMLQQLLVRFKLDQAAAEAAAATLRAQDEANVLKDSPDVVLALEMDPRLRSLRQEELNLMVALESDLEKYGGGHRTVQSVRSRLEAVKNMAKDREKKVIDYRIAALKEERKAVVESLTVSLLSIQGEYDVVFAGLQDVEKDAIVKAVVEEKVKSLEDRRRRVEDRLEDTRMAGKGEQLIKVVGPAEVPLFPAMPKWSIMMPLGVFLGIVIGLGLAFLLEFMDTSIKSPGDIARRFSMPILGMVPHVDDIDEEVDDIRTLLMTKVDSLISESFRRIRTCLMFSAPTEHRKVVLITSAQPEDGRTSVTMNMAASIAHEGRKVLVVDTNFWRPVASQLFAGADHATRGLCNVLVGQNEWRDLVHELNENIHIIATGPMPPNPAELLGSERMRQFLAEVSSQYDQVLLDGAPCLVVSDTIVLSTLVDGVIFVIRAGINTYGIVQRASDMLGGVGARVLGAVLNGVRVTAGGYLQETYDTFYDYQERAKLPAE